MLSSRHYSHISVNGGRDLASRSAAGSFRLSEAPESPPEETERIERLVERVLEEHRETIEKLADE